MKFIKIILTSVMTAVLGTSAAQKTMSGKIYDNNREPLTGALVVVENSDIATISTVEGTYRLEIPKKYENNDVVFRYAGFLPKTVPAVDGRADIVFDVEVVKEFEDIFVSTQKRLQSSVEVPVAVTALDRNTLEKLGVSQIDEISGFVPGFNAVVQSQNKGGYSIRGVTSDGMESFFQPRISVFLNGVSSSRAQSAVIEPFDMERIEVVKGPQGTLFGRGAEIGAVHYITKRPEKTFSAEASVNYGGYNQRGVQGFVNIPAGEKFADRFAFCYDHHDGYIKNLDGGTLNGKGTIALRNTLSFFHKDKSTFNLILDYQYDKTPGVCFKSNRIAPEGGDTSPFTAAYLNNSDDLCVTRHLGGLTLEYDREISSRLNISNTFGIHGSSCDEFFDPDGTYLHILDAEEKVKSLQFSEEFRLNWDNNGSLNGFVGAGAMFERCEHSIILVSDERYLFPLTVAPSLKGLLSGVPEQVATGVADAIRQNFSMLDEATVSYVSTEIQSRLTENFDEWFSGTTWEKTPDIMGGTKHTVEGVLISALNARPDILKMFGGATAEQVVGQLDIESQLAGLDTFSNIPMQSDYREDQTNITNNFESDIFADLNWNVARNLYLTFGLRGTYEKQKSGYSSESMTAPIVGTMVYENSGGKTVWTSEDYFSWVGRFIINYMINKTNNVYLSAAKGRMPGVVYFSYSPENPVKLQPEETYSYEIGLKGNVMKNSLSYALAAYYYDWRHFQSSTMQYTESGTHVFANDDKGKAHGLGAEVSLKYYFKRFVTFFGDFAYLDAKFAKRDEDGNEQQLAGNSFRLSSKYTCDFGFDVSVPLGERLALYFRPNYLYKSKMYFQEENYEEYSQDGYGIFNASLGLKFSADRLSYDFSFWGKNIGNTEYLIDAGNAGKSIGFPTFIAGAPANFGVRLVVGFK